MKKFKSLFFLFAIFVLSVGFSACEKKGTMQMQKIHWDRDMCERCKMVLSDRYHAVQIINTLNGKSYKYDDIGCAILWFEDENIDWKVKANIWITDSTSGKWIDARTAFYTTYNITPMAYGFSAHEYKDTIKAGKEVISFAEMDKQVVKHETKMRGTY